MDTHPLALEVCRAEGLDARAGTLPDELPFEPGSADVVVLSDVLEHVEPDHASAAAAAKLLRAGGILVCTVPAHPWMWTPRDDLHHHVRRYRKREYERVFENAGCERVLVSWYNTTLFPAMIAARSIAKWSRSTPSPDVRGLPAPLNATLDAVFSAERAWLTRGPLPFGASLISVYRRRPN
jgi:SAM-dependent methyltransferase